MRTLGEYFARCCDGKVRHVNKNDADKEARRMERIEHAPFNSYPCICCGFWHVGHDRERLRRERGVKC